MAILRVVCFHWIALIAFIAARVEAQSAPVVYLDAVTTYCYQSLIADGECCRDKMFSPGVSNIDVNRPDTAWTCTSPPQGFCLDSKTGPRGQDKLWWPDGADCTTPRMLYIHGGSWRYHGPTQASYDVLASKLAKETGASVLVPDHILVPVGNYSDMLRSSLAAWNWMAKHGPGGQDCSGAPAPPLFIAGDSSGGTTALSLLIKLHIDAGAGLAAAGFIAFSPWTNLACDTPTYYTNSFAQIVDLNGALDYVGDILSRDVPRNKTAVLKQIAHSYVTGSMDPIAGNMDLLTDQFVSPFYAKNEILQGLPPIYLAVSGTESMTGDSVIFGSRAALQGVPVVLDIFYGMWHVFPQYSEGCGSEHDLWQGRAVLEHAGDFVRQVSKVAKNQPAHVYERRNAVAGGQPETHIYYIYPTGHKPWIEVRPLSLGMLLTPKEQAMQESQQHAMDPVAIAPTTAAVVPTSVPNAPMASALSPTAPSKPPASGWTPVASGGWTPKATHDSTQTIGNAPAIVTDGLPPTSAVPSSQTAAPEEEDQCPQETLLGAFLTGAAGGAIGTGLLVAGIFWYYFGRHGLSLRSQDGAFADMEAPMGSKVNPLSPMRSEILPADNSLPRNEYDNGGDIRTGNSIQARHEFPGSAADFTPQLDFGRSAQHDFPRTIQHDYPGSNSRGGSPSQNGRFHDANEPSPTEHLRPPSPASPPSPPLTNAFGSSHIDHHVEHPRAGDHDPGTGNSFDDRLAAADPRNRNGFNNEERDSMHARSRGSPPRQKKPSDVWSFFGVQVPDCGTSACAQAGLPSNIDGDAYVDYARHSAASSPMGPSPHSRV